MYWNPNIIYSIESQKKFKELITEYKDKILELKKTVGPIYDIFPDYAFQGSTIAAITKDAKYILRLATLEWINIKKVINGLSITKDDNDNLYYIEGNVIRIINRLKHHEIYPYIDMVVYSLYELGITTELDFIGELEKEELWKK
jgi:hypothetical protein